MKALSRTMPPIKLQRQLGGFGRAIFWSVVFGGLVVALWFAFTRPPTAWILGPCIIAYSLLVLRVNRAETRVREERKCETIGTFARALPARDHDTWVVRAVYEELSQNRGFSVRPTDRLLKDLGLCSEELELCSEEIGRRANRSPVDARKNPLFGRLATVADLVTFFECQPQIDDAQKMAASARASS